MLRSIKYLMTVLSLSVLVSLPVAADESPAPVRLDNDLIAGIGLSSLPENPFKDIVVSGEMNISVASLYEGEEVNVAIFESTPAKTDHRNMPLDVDEFVLVLSGKLILADTDGTVQEFTPGDYVVVPKGYRGTWEMQGLYRELVVMKARPEKK